MSPAGDAVSETAFRAGIAALLALFAALLWRLSVQDEFGGFNWDDAWYVLLADRLAGRLDALPQLSEQLVATRAYPPGYPAWLALFGGGSESLARAHVANLAACVLGAACFALWLRREGMGRVATLVLTAGVAMSPFTLRHALALWSENLYVAFVLAALAAVAAREPRSGHWLFAASACALAALTRSSGVALIGAFIVVLLVRRPPRAWLWALVAVVPAGAERLLAKGPSYVDAAASSPLVGAAAWFDLAHALGFGWVEGLSFGTPSNGQWALCVGLFALCLPTLFARLRAVRLDAVYVVAHLAMIAAYGFWSHMPRFLLPLMPIAVFYAATTLGATVRRLAPLRPHGATLAALVLCALLVAPSAAHFGARAGLAAPPGLEPYRRSVVWWLTEPVEAVLPAAFLRRGMIADMRGVARLVPPDACVTSEFPPVVMLHARRRAVMAPWRTFAGAVDARDDECRYYYVVPSLVPDPSDPEVLARAFDIRLALPVVAGDAPIGYLLERRAPFFRTRWGRTGRAGCRLRRRPRRAGS